MTHVHRVRGWSVTLPVLKSRQRFVSFAKVETIGIDRAFFFTRRAARAHLRLTNLGRRRRWTAGRLVRAELALRVFDEPRGRR